MNDGARDGVGMMGNDPNSSLPTGVRSWAELLASPEAVSARECVYYRVHVLRELSEKDVRAAPESDDRALIQHILRSYEAHEEAAREAVTTLWPSIPHEAKVLLRNQLHHWQLLGRFKQRQEQLETDEFMVAVANAEARGALPNKLGAVFPDMADYPGFARIARSLETLGVDAEFLSTAMRHVYERLSRQIAPPTQPGQAQRCRKQGCARVLVTLRPDTIAPGGAMRIKCSRCDTDNWIAFGTVQPTAPPEDADI